LLDVIVGSLITDLYIRIIIDWSSNKPMTNIGFFLDDNFVGFEVWIISVKMKGEFGTHYNK